MSRQARRLLARGVRAAIHVLIAALLLVAPAVPAPAHDGDHHHDEAPAHTAPQALASPRVATASGRYQLVGIVEGEVLVVYLDRADDNAPVTGASVEVALDGTPLAADLQAKTATYEVTAPILRQAGQHELRVTVMEGAARDLLVGTLVIPDPAAAHVDADRGALAVAVDELVEALGEGRKAIAFAGVLLIAAAGGGTLLSGRRKLLIVPAALLGLILASAIAWAHEGHDHGPDLRASAGNAPARRSDGTLFVPKPTQRLLELRTEVAVVASRPRTARLQGRIVPDPNRSGVVQSTLQGRYEAPQGGVPPLGTKVKAGDLLGRVAASFASIDASDMMQTLGGLDQEIALNRRKLARQEQLLASNAVAKAAVEDTRIQLEGLERRRQELLSARVRPEDLRAPVDGVIAATRVVAGQVVGPSDQLFQIIDPARLMVEAVVFDQIEPDAVSDATASLGNGGLIKLRFLGRSRALQQQYALLQFQIVEAPVPLDAGTPVTVVAVAGERVTGIVLPRSALAQAPSGQTVVFSHKEPEVFVPRPVRVEPLDGESVLVTAGIAAGERIVVRNAPLLNQVR